MEDFDARRASLDLVTAFVNNNKLSAGELPALLSDVFKAISGFETATEERAKAGGKPMTATAEAKASAPAGTKTSSAPAVPAQPKAIKSPAPKKEDKAPRGATPAMSVKESLSDPDFIVSFITGEKFKTLKRHLRKHGLTEAGYKARFNLPDDYPIVAPSYSQVRRNVAYKIHGTGENTRTAGEAAATPAPQAKDEASEAARAKPAPKEASGAKEADIPAAGPAKGRIPRGSSTKGAANAASETAPQSPDAHDGAVAADAKPAIQAASVNAHKAEAKAPAEKQMKKRRMARQPVADTKPSDAVAVPAAAKEAKEGIGSEAPPKGRSKSRKASGAPAVLEGAKVKPARKERKKLSPVFG